MRIGSLFAGIGGFDLAARWMGWETAWYSEIDPYCCAVMAHHFPEARSLGDVTAVDWSGVERVDLMCGGFPCQDISVAGKRKGITGERSGLWKEYARAVDGLRPRWVVVENVGRLLRAGYDVVRGDLRALGYRVARPVVLSAAALGAPHERQRLWIVACLADAGRAGLQGLRGTERVRPEQPDTRGNGASMEQPSGERRGEGRAESTGLEGRQAPTGPSGTVEHPERGRREQRDPGERRVPEPDAGREAVGYTHDGTGSPEPQLQYATSVAEPWATGVLVRGCDGTVRLVPPAQPEIRALDDGVSDGLARDPLYEAGWPVCGKVPHRTARLRAIGNAIVPQADLPGHRRSGKPP